ncbi:papain-like cysteine protease family protein [Desulfolutivibrio sulfoxidireducens]|uniref:papain-like cysteine protease family protein n=1 Tax=Desulfolutivibrio sulfoxidireducens TaxID=2773299 RepID=UPI00159DABC0|nr:papain-like cysteine protease family protein [Desulfolutivibrio sulfoxidireducens]QLA15260.1 hypothetical protein GD605_03455 [Desulfolutivibrio sulfoxidireducens]QLA18828.1 hypothetical protein GD604_03335 [Desulfolutivibrio sulfoxidireducens]
MPHMIRCIYFILLAALAGCVQVGMVSLDIFPIVIPKIDETIRSTTYYLEKYNYDCSTKQHSMKDEIKASADNAKATNKMMSKIRIFGKTLHVNPIDEIYRKAEKRGNNDYVLGCKNSVQMQKQISDLSCWAACTQYLIAAKFNAAVSQEALLEKVKSRKKQNSLTSAGEITEIMNALGFLGLEYTTSGSRQLLQSLAENQPVMIGLLPDNPNEEGHAVVVVAARFSFAGTATPSCLRCSKYGFSEFVILDPEDGSVKVVNAAEYDDKIYFVLSYMSQET